MNLICFTIQTVMGIIENIICVICIQPLYVSAVIKIKMIYIVRIQNAMIMIHVFIDDLFVIHAIWNAHYVIQKLITPFIGHAINIIDAFVSIVSI